MNCCCHRVGPSPDGVDPRPPGRRAYLLGQIVTTLPLLVVAATLATGGIHATLKSQKRSAEIVAGYAAIDSLLNALRLDTRAATAARAVPADRGAFAFVLQTSGGEVGYSFTGGRATRAAGGANAHGKAPREWRIIEASLSAEFEAPHTASGDQHSGNQEPGSPFSLLRVHIRWRGESKRQVDPARRFDVTFSIGRGYQR